MSQKGLIHPSLSQPTMGYKRGRKMRGKRKRGGRRGGSEEGRKGAGAVALIGYYKGSSRRKRMCMVLRGAIYVIKRKHVVIKFL